MRRSPFRTNFNYPSINLAQRLLIGVLALESSFFFFCGVTIGEESDAYLHHIKPLLTEKCISCHGALRSEAGLRLDAIQFVRSGSDSGSIVESDNANCGKLLERVSCKDMDLRMPPEDAGTALTKDQIRLLADWIEARLPGPDQETFLSSPLEHWAYQTIVRPPVPESTQANPYNPIDHFIYAAQQAKVVRSLAPTSDAVWLRRVTFDVSGLPPTVDDVHRFIEDKSANKRDTAIDRLLSQTTYGERWGRHWMDIWRYSDWDGYKNELRTSQRHIWHWRDWIIDSLNANKPYDKMVVEMLAADELSPENRDALRATGFLARNFHKSNRNIWLDATVEHTAKAFLGMTLNCAKCHDHKYDPIPQTAYYQFRAVFEPHRIRTEQVPGVSNLEKDGIPRAYDDDLNAATFLYVRGNDKNPLKDSPVEPSVPNFFRIPFDIVPVELPLESYYPELSDLVRQNVLADKEKAIKAATAKLRAKLDHAEKPYVSNPSDLQSERLEQFADDIELLSSELKVVLADRASTVARYAAEKAKYAPKPDFDSSYARRPDSLGTFAIQSERKLSFARHATETIICATQPIFKTESTTTKRTARNQLAKEASLAEFWLKRAQASHDLLLKQRALTAAETLSSKAVDVTKRDAMVKSTKEELEKAQQNFDAIPSQPDADSTSYTPVGKELSHYSSGRRMALAKWIVHPNNPLTARVAINHIWLRHFGTPLVENTFDFGMSSPKPELVDLLNWLAAELISSDWDMKHIHRLILLSEVYALASDDSDVDLYQTNSARDPENETYWRANIRRLDAEEVRDSMLAVSQTLDDRLSGPDIDFAEGESVMRRSLYFRHAYEKQMPMLVLFDAASPNECYRRKPSLVPQQALALANSSLARRMAKRLGEVIQKEMSQGHANENSDEGKFIDRLFQSALARRPSPEERETCMAFLASQTSLMSDPSRLTRFSDDDKISESDQTPNERARQSLAIVLFNHHDFVTIR